MKPAGWRFVSEAAAAASDVVSVRNLSTATLSFVDRLQKKHMNGYWCAVKFY